MGAANALLVLGVAVLSSAIGALFVVVLDLMRRERCDRSAGSLTAMKPAVDGPGGSRNSNRTDAA